MIGIKTRDQNISNYLSIYITVMVVQCLSMCVYELTSSIGLDWTLKWCVCYFHVALKYVWYVFDLANGH